MSVTEHHPLIEVDLAKLCARAAWRHHIVDHHHLGMALLQEGVERVSVMLLADLSYLAPRSSGA